MIFLKHLARLQLVCTLIISLWNDWCCSAYSIRQHGNRRKPSSVLHISKPETSSTQLKSSDNDNRLDTSRRIACISLAQGALLLPAIAQAASLTDNLVETAFGEASWDPLDRAALLGLTTSVPPLFSTYAARILINYDSGVGNWWKQLDESCALLSQEKRTEKLSKSFGELAKSVELGVEDWIVENKTYELLWDLFMDKYGDLPEAKRQFGILFALLPQELQPHRKLRPICGTSLLEEQSKVPVLPEFSSLLSQDYQCTQLGSHYTVDPPILNEVSVNSNGGQETVLGPLSVMPLTREKPHFSSKTYALFALSGAAGCALTHTIVIPLVRSDFKQVRYFWF
jgi:hypothetical protein